MDKTLVILAAGMASRYGGNKQIDGFGPNQETILEYSIYDAIRSGFTKVCFIIRDEHHALFQEKFGNKVSAKIEVSYAFQKPQLEEYGFNDAIERSKPWGTGHALLAAREEVTTPFCVINADDFYSSVAFEKMADFLENRVSDQHASLLGYTIGKTLSDSGPVTRGVCAIDQEGNLLQLDERAKVYRDAEEKIVFEQHDGEPGELPEDAPVSMNFWGFTPAIFDQLRPLFLSFVEENKSNPKAEFLIPEAAQQLLKAGTVSFEVIAVDAPCFGVTYQEDKVLVKDKLKDLIENGLYPQNLWN